MSVLCKLLAYGLAGSKYLFPALFNDVHPYLPISEMLGLSILHIKIDLYKCIELVKLIELREGPLRNTS